MTLNDTRTRTHKGQKTRETSKQKQAIFQPLDCFFLVFLVVLLDLGAGGLPPLLLHLGTLLALLGDARGIIGNDPAVDGGHGGLGHVWAVASLTLLDSLDWGIELALWSLLGSMNVGCVFDVPVWLLASTPTPGEGIAAAVRPSRATAEKRDSFILTEEVVKKRVVRFQKYVQSESERMSNRRQEKK